MGPVAQSGAGPVADPQPAFSSSDRPETGLSPASARAVVALVAGSAGRASRRPRVGRSHVPRRHHPTMSDWQGRPRPMQTTVRRLSRPGHGPGRSAGCRTRCRPDASSDQPEGPGGRPGPTGREARRAPRPAAEPRAPAATASTWIPSTTASTPSSSMRAWRTMSAWLPARKVCVRPAVAMPSVRVLAVERRDLGVLRDEGPRDAAHREDATEDVGPGAADRVGVHAAGRSAVAVRGVGGRGAAPPAAPLARRRRPSARPEPVSDAPARCWAAGDAGLGDGGRAADRLVRRHDRRCAGLGTCRVDPTRVARTGRATGRPGSDRPRDVLDAGAAAAAAHATGGVRAATLRMRPHACGGA